jgi:hypothetical protein
MRWEDPAQDERGQRGKYDEFVKELKTRPGQWAVLHPKAEHPSHVPNVNKGKIASFRPAGDFEATSRGNGDGTYKIYVRYVGEGT